mmetsp:Transcript_1144/g.1239  ORF Transcript_1144/g.1239 Transcript_1144/m.1239 type:complete len:367 (-) Transcript_1144:185-1285(-)
MLNGNTTNGNGNGNGHADYPTNNHIYQKDQKELYPLHSGLPPWHTLVLLVVGLLLFVPNLPTLESIDEYATVDILTNRKFPTYLSLWGLGMVRLSIGGMALASTIYLILFGKFDVDPGYLKSKSKLRNIGTLKVQGFGTLCSFSSLSWLILGVGFLLRGILCIALYRVQQQQQDSTTTTTAVTMMKEYVVQNAWFLRMTFLLWELTGPFAMLTSSVAKYLIWPMAIKSKRKHNLTGYTNQLQHNGNSILSLCEVALWGDTIPVVWTHVSIATTFGCLYFLFTWITAKYYFGSPQSSGPQYIYFCMDTTLGAITSIAMVGLCGIMTVLYLVFAGVIQLLDQNTNEESVVANIVFVVIGTALVCKFRE